MAKKKHGRGDGRQPQRRHLQSVPARPAEPVESQALFETIRKALRSGEPLELLSVVAGFLELTDPRSGDPFAREESGVSLDDLVESFVAVSYAETTAALIVIKALVPDELLAGRIARELQTRRHPMPEWLRELDSAPIEPDVWFLTHVLGDGDDYLFGLSLPSGHALSGLVYVDHNLGTVLKDAFVVPQPLEDFALLLGTKLEDPDQLLTRTDAATARAVVEEAIEHGSRMYPPLQTDTWPMCRPLIEWMLRKLPAGGRAPERKEWSDAERAAIASDFFGSRFGAPVNREDERSLMETVLWFGTGYATGDPLNWSPVTVELILADWVPRKIVADPPYLAKLPDLLRAFIRYCHDRKGIRHDLTAETLAAVDHYEPAYLRDIRSARPEGPAALVASMLEMRNPEDEYGDLSAANLMLEGLAEAVGGRVQLRNLDDSPLPDEPFEWAGVPEDIGPVVAEVLDWCDRCADALLDLEHRTAMRRFLSRAAVSDPAIFRRKASPARGAAAVAWVICRANDTAGYWKALSVQDLLAWFGVKGGGVSQRAEPFLRANGVNPHALFGSMDLGAPDLLTSQRRADIIAARDRWLAEAEGGS